MEFTEPQSFKCNSCKAAFSSVEKVKDHYKSDWHVFNSKRRTQNLLPLSKADFKLIRHTLPPSRRGANSSTSSVNATLPPASISLHFPSSLPTISESDAVITSASNDDELVGEAEDIELNSENSVAEEDMEILHFGALPVDPTISIFDDSKFDSVEDCLEYMTSTYGLFIPDSEYLTDLTGLITYLGRKVKQGGICLYCQRAFRSAYSCQDHMKSRSHCKIAYEEDVDMEEFEDFYDFSSMHSDGEEDEEEGRDGTLQVSHIGELVLMDGRTVGHRDFRVYYKQKFRPEDTRPAVLAQEREELLRLGSRIGMNKVRTSDLALMSDMEVRTLMIRYHKDMRRGQIVEQRGMHKRLMLDQRREYHSKVDKARSSINTTAKIRDYHKTVM